MIMRKNTKNTVTSSIFVFILATALIFITLSILKLIFIVFALAIVVGAGLFVWFSGRHKQL